MGFLDSYKLKSEKGESTGSGDDVPTYTQDSDAGDVITSENADNLQRRLGNREIQLIAIGGSIGTALFVSIGQALGRGGPGSLLIAFTAYSCMLALVNNCIAEMTVLMPVSGGFIRLAGHWVDDALGFMAGWNFFLYEALLIPFEIVALNLVLAYWRSDIPVWAVCIGCIILYGLINMLAVRAYGEAEFWLSGGKVILILSLFCFTFITMVGGNPRRDAYGFSNWKKPDAFAEYRSTGDLGRFEGFLAALWSAAFTVVGPEYISMVAAEAKRPRIYIKTAFKTVYFRFGLFFIGGALAVGIVVPYTNDTIVRLASGEASADNAAASPYVLAMQNLGITIFPDIVNALLITSIFSAGNTYTYCATRSLYGLSLEGRAPKFLRYCTGNGVPIFCFAIVMIFPFLSFLQVSNSSAKALTVLTSIITAGGMINYVVMLITYIFFYRAVVAQGVDRNLFPYKGYFQPYGAYIALVWETVVLFCFGYASFGPWSVETFFYNYTMLILAPILFFGWKIIKRTKLKKAHEVDLVWQRPVIDAYEATFLGPPVGFWTEMIQMFGIKRTKGGNDQRANSVSA